MISASNDALNMNHALLANIPKLKPTPNHPKKMIEFM